MTIAIVLKGITLGLVMFFVFTWIYIRAYAGRVFPVMGLAAFRSIITHNWLYWTAGVLFLALGCVIMAIWPIKVPAPGL